MDENVVFNPNQQQPASGDPVAATPDTGAVPPVAQTPVDPNSQVPVDPNALADQNTPVDPNVPVDPNAQVPVEGDGTTETGEVAADGTQVGIEEPPPPAGFLGGGMLKKILIGVGALIFIIVIIVIVASLNKAQPTKQVKLQWWGLWEDPAAVQSLISDFKKTHPTIDVEYVKKDPDQYRDRLTARIENGSGPDIFRYHNTWLPMIGNDLSPLTSDVISPDEFKNAYYPVMQQDLTKNGAIYGIPMDADSLALFINPQLFDAAGVQVPTNWDQFNDAAKALTVKTPVGKIKTAGAALGTYSNINHAPDIISLLLVQQGVDINKLTTFPKNEAGALSYYASFAKSPDTNVWDDTLDNSLLAFSKGNLAMYFGYSWDIFEIQKLNSNLQFKVYPVPSNQGVKTTIASYWVEGVSAKSPNQKEAMEFMHYLAQKDTAQKFYTETAKTRAFGELYPRKDLQSSLQENPLAYPFIKELNDASSSFFASNTHDGDTGINSLMNTYLQTSVDSLTGDSGSADQAVTDLNNGVSQVLQKYGGQ